MKNTSQKINKNIKNISTKIIPTLKQYDVAKASLFGSIVRGENKKESDIDILIEFKGKKSLIDLVELEFKLKKLLKKDVDLITYKSLHPLLRDRILSEQQQII